MRNTSLPCAAAFVFVFSYNTVSLELLEFLLKDTLASPAHAMTLAEAHSLMGIKTCRVQKAEVNVEA